MINAYYLNHVGYKDTFPPAVLKSIYCMYYLNHVGYKAQTRLCNQVSQDASII